MRSFLQVIVRRVLCALGPVRRDRWPIHLVAALSGAGWVLCQVAPEARDGILASRWSPEYWLLAPLLHDQLWHLLLNALALFFLGEPLARLLSARRFLALVAGGAAAANLANNIFADFPAIGISGAVFAILACLLYPHGRAPMKFVGIHDLLRLRPFPLWKIAAGLLLLDLAGAAFNWGLFAHWGHLGGFAAGMGMGWIFFRRPPDIPIPMILRNLRKR